MRKIEFEKPISENKLQLIILETIRGLGFNGQWHFKHEYSYSTMKSYATSEKVKGYIAYGAQVITEFNVNVWADDHFQEPMFANIEFKPPFGSEEGAKLFEDNIDKIYAEFQKKYQTYKD